MMRKLGWVSALAAVAIGGCGDDGDGNDTGVGTTATATATMTDTDTPTTDTEATTDNMTTGEDESGSGSTSGSGADCSSPPSHAADIQPIWDASCVAACHEAGGSWPSTDLTPAMAYDMLVEADGIQTMALTDVQLVIPGDTENSYLLNKLNNTQADVAGAAAGTQMPQGVDPLTADQIALVEQWIACGAEM